MEGKEPDEPSSQEKVITEEEQLTDEMAALKQVLAEEKSRAEEYLANWQRAQADFINFKKRSEQEKGEATKFANAMLILNLLPVLDDLERALDSLPANLAGLTWIDGIRLIYRKLQAVLEAQGLSPIKAEGEKFDPNLHEAVMHGEGEEEMITQELQRGYKLHDRVIRPTMVVVGKGKEEGEAEGEEG
jgi:molecular chaperone GrpE